MNIAITGATGHIGVNLCRRLHADGHTLRALARRKPPFWGLEDLKISWIQGDIRDESAVQQLVRGAEVVVHLAAKISIQGDRDGSVWETNTKGPEYIAAACLEAGVRRLVHVSSVHAFNLRHAGGMLDESTPLVGPDGFAYDRSKAAGQGIIQSAVENGLDAVILNPTGVIGPWDFGPSLMGQTFLRLYHQQLPALVKGGFDFVDVRDVVDAVVAAMNRGKPGECYLLGGQYVPIPDLAKLAAEITGRKAPRWAVGIRLAKLGVPFFGIWAKLTDTHPLFTFESLSALENEGLHISTRRAESQLGFRARPLRDTIEDVYNWFEAHQFLG